MRSPENMDSIIAHAKMIGNGFVIASVWLGTKTRPPYVHVVQIQPCRTRGF